MRELRNGLADQVLTGLPSFTRQFIQGVGEFWIEFDGRVYHANSLAALAETGNGGQ